MEWAFFYRYYFIVFMLCFARNYSLLYFFYPTRQLSATIKAGLAIVLTTTTFYINKPFICHSTEFIFLLLINVTYGFMLGFTISIPFYLLEMNGSLLDNFRGETVASSITKSFVPKQSSMFTFLNICFLTYFITNDGLILMIKTLMLSYKAFPLNQFKVSLVQDHLLVIIEHLFTWFGIISYPIIMLSLLIDMLFAFSAVIVPNLNTFFLEFPVKSTTLILFYFFFIPTLFVYLTKYFMAVINYLGIG